MLKVYITDLAAYNQGFLVGKWVSLPLDQEDQEDLEERVLEILKEGSKICGFNEEHEEYFITDYEFEEIKLFDVSEYSNLQDLNHKCEQVSILSEDNQKRIAYLINHVSFNFDDALERYEDVYIYENMTIRDVVEQYIDETIDMSNIPSIIANNIDYDSIAKDFEISGEYDSVDNDVYYFTN